MNIPSDPGALLSSISSQIPISSDAATLAMMGLGFMMLRHYFYGLLYRLLPLLLLGYLAFGQGKGMNFSQQAFSRSAVETSAPATLPAMPSLHSMIEGAKIPLAVALAALCALSALKTLSRRYSYSGRRFMPAPHHQVYAQPTFQQPVVSPPQVLQPIVIYAMPPPAGASHASEQPVPPPQSQVIKPPGEN